MSDMPTLLRAHADLIDLRGDDYDSEELREAATRIERTIERVHSWPSHRLDLLANEVEDILKGTQ